MFLRLNLRGKNPFFYDNVSPSNESTCDVKIVPSFFLVSTASVIHRSKRHMGCIVLIVYLFWKKAPRIVSNGFDLVLARLISSFSRSSNTL